MQRNFGSCNHNEYILLATAFYNIGSDILLETSGCAYFNSTTRTPNITRTTATRGDYYESVLFTDNPASYADFTNDFGSSGGGAFLRTRTPISPYS